jgi:hypothetical protein
MHASPSRAKVNAHRPCIYLCRLRFSPSFISKMSHRASPATHSSLHLVPPSLVTMPCRLLTTYVPCSSSVCHHRSQHRHPRTMTMTIRWSGGIRWRGRRGPNWRNPSRLPSSPPIRSLVVRGTPIHIGGDQHNPRGTRDGDLLQNNGDGGVRPLAHGH